MEDRLTMKAIRLLGFGVLVTLLSVLGAYVSSAAVSAQRPVDELAPAGSLLFVGVNDVGQMISEMENMPLGKIMDEEGVRTFLETPIKMFQDWVSQGVKEIENEAGIEHLDVDHILCSGYGRAFVVLTHVKLPDMQTTMEPEVGLVIGIEPREGTVDLSGLIQTFVAKQVATMKEAGFDNVGIEESQYADTSMKLVRMPGGPPLCFANVDGLSLISLNPSSLKKVIDLAGGNGASLASDPIYQGASRRLGAGHPGSISLYANTPALVALLSAGVKLGLGASGNDTWAGKVEPILAASGLADAGAMASVSISADGVGIQRSYVGVSGQPHGLMSMVESKPVDIGKLAWVPKEALSCSLAHFDFKKFWDVMMGMAKAADEGIHQQIQGMLSMISAQLSGADPNQAGAGSGSSYDLAEDLLGSLGSEMISYSVPTQGFMATGEYVMALEAKDPAQVIKGLQMLCQIPGMMLDTPIKLKEVAATGATLYTIDLTEANPAFAMVAAQFQPTFAFKDGYMVMSTTLHGVKRALERLSGPIDPADSILANEDFKRFYGKIPQGVPLVTLGYANIRQSFESIYNQLISFTFMPPFSTMLENLPIDLALLPTSDEIGKHLFGSMSFAYRVEGGVVGESYGPFGAELMPVLAGAAGLGALLAVRLEESGMPMGMGGLEPSTEAVPVRAEAESPESKVTTDFGNIKAGILVFKLDQGKLPDSLQDLLHPSDTYPGGYLPDSNLPSDPWGNAYRYQKVDRDNYRLWTVGPNGKDEGGNGDDMMVTN